MYSRTGEEIEGPMNAKKPLLRGALEAIAIDGPAGVGKSSVGQEAAIRLGWRFIDTGAMYRSVALLARERNLPPEKWPKTMEELDIRFQTSEREQRVFIGKRDVTKAIRTHQITAAVKEVADHTGVREVARALQKRLATGGKVVMEGRDICSYVLPDARYKFYFDATQDARVERRMKQLLESGIEADASEVADAVSRRDEEDRKRDIAPLAPAADAFYVDTTYLSRSEVVDLIVGIVEADTGLGSSPPRNSGRAEHAG